MSAEQTAPLTSRAAWTTTDDVDHCAVLCETVTETLSRNGDRFYWTTADAEAVLVELRRRGYDIVPSPAFQPPF